MNADIAICCCLGCKDCMCRNATLYSDHNALLTPL